MIRALRWISTLLVLSLAALFIKQNMPTFSIEVPFYYDLHIRQEMMWYYSIGEVVIISLLIGIFVGFCLGFRLYMAKRREISKLKQNLENTANKTEKTEVIQSPIEA